MSINTGALPEWARAHGAPLFAATIRDRPSDFQVVENLGFEFSGSGEHDYLWVEKTAANTDWVARQLARHAGVRPADVGYAGMKDRHAVTRQWFSVPGRGAADWASFAADGAVILGIHRHQRKLRRGAHKSNAFRIALRTPDAGGMRQTVDERLASIAARGLPNYFGPQRFGRDGANLDLARRLFAGARLKRDKRSIAISAARSFLFNQILSARVADGSWERILPGEVVNLDGSGSVFRADAVDESLERRVADMDIHPTATLWGLRSEISPGVIESLERRVAEAHSDLSVGLEQLGVKAAHRPLRLRVSDLSWDVEDDALWLDFTLPAGGFATAVLREIART
ncbi:MAG: tRNA pseudouridine(13) synthase TruD [Gammaproteobacteria bacterium]|nr:tRNA pseudouridine(13) synthase TruD [Gammaproteobacteria bacterium]MDH3864655.1 tRNA pseudouridine(13) synthase TruD [Gammaproteobacteria bacterium]